MGDDIVDAVSKAQEDLAFANGLNMTPFHPIIDSIVNRLRRSGLSDEAILAALAPSESEDAG